MSSKGRIMRSADTVPYDMPFLEVTATDGPGQGAEDFREVHPEQRAEEIEREAYERGFSAGEKSGFEMGEHKAAILLDRLDTIVAEITALRDNLVKELEPQVLELAVAIARKIVLSELSLQPETTVRMVREAMRRIEKTGRITIRINPALHELFLKLKPELLELYPDIVYEVDPSSPVTGPLVVGEREEVATDINMQLDDIAEQLGGGLGAL